MRKSIWVRVIEKEMVPAPPEKSDEYAGTQDSLDAQRPRTSGTSGLLRTDARSTRFTIAAPQDKANRWVEVFFGEGHGTSKGVEIDISDGEVLKLCGERPTYILWDAIVGMNFAHGD